MRPLFPFLCCALALAGCANDKTMHFVAGAAASKYVIQKTQSPIQGCATAIASGIAKELYDSKFGGVVDSKDALVTGAAGCMYTIRF